MAVRCVLVAVAAVFLAIPAGAQDRNRFEVLGGLNLPNLNGAMAEVGATAWLTERFGLSARYVTYPWQDRFGTAHWGHDHGYVTIRYRGWVGRGDDVELDFGIGEVLGGANVYEELVHTGWMCELLAGFDVAEHWRLKTGVGVDVWKLQDAPGAFRFSFFFLRVF